MLLACWPLHTFSNLTQALPLFMPLHGKFLQFDWFRAVVFRLYLKYLHAKITNLFWGVA